MFQVLRSRHSLSVTISVPLLSVALLVIIMAMWPGVIPFTFSQFWTVDRFGQGLLAAWPFFAWSGLSMVGSLICDHHLKQRYERGAVWRGVAISLYAGISEELKYRWIGFYLMIVGAKIANLLIFGFLGFGIPEFLNTHVLFPLANFATLSILRDYLCHNSNYGGWAVGAAILISNGKFRSAHSYLGHFGWVNSWFLGVGFFYLTLKYGLPVAIVTHVIYDLMIIAVPAAVGRWLR